MSQNGIFARTIPKICCLNGQLRKKGSRGGLEAKNSRMFMILVDFIMVKKWKKSEGVGKGPG